MPALQTAPPALGSALVALVGLALVGALLGATGSVVVRRLSNPVGKYRLLYAAVLFPLTLLAYGVLAFLGFGHALLALGPSAPGPLTDVLASFVTFLAAGGVWLAAYAPTVRGVRDVRGLTLSTTTALGKMARYVIGFGAVLTVVLAPIQATPASASPVVLAGTLSAVGVLLLYASPWVVALLRSTETPTGDVADRVSGLRSRAGLDVRDVRVLDTDDEETATTLVRGPPNYRRLFVTSTFLDAFDDGTATALLAVEAGRLRYHVFEVRVGTAVVAGVALVASLTGVGPRWPLLGLSVAALVVGCWLSRRGIRAADEDAAERVGTSSLAAALERHAEVHALEPTRRRLPNPLSVNVALGDRIDRLRAAAEP